MRQDEIYAKLLDEGFKSEWNNFVDSSPWGDILQFWQWGETKRSEGWKPIRIGVFRSKNLILAAQCLLKNASFLGGYLYVPHGPVFRSTEALRAGLPVLVRKFKTLAEETGSFAVEIEPKLGKLVEAKQVSENLEHFVDPEIVELFEKEGFAITGRNMQPKYKLFYDLEMTEDELLMLMKKNTRYNVRLAEKKGVRVKEYLADDPQIQEKLVQFYDMLKSMQERAKGYPVRPFTSFQRFFDEFRETKNISLFEATFDGDLITMNISERTGYWASSFYAGAYRIHNEVKAAYLLRWRSVQAAKNFGSKIYDFWGIIPGSAQHKGYSDTKLSFGGIRIDHYGIFAMPVNKTKYIIWDKLLPLRVKLFELLRRFRP